MGRSHEKDRTVRKGVKKMANEKEQMTISLSAELKEKLCREAEDRGYTVNELITFILWENVREATAPE